MTILDPIVAHDLIFILLGFEGDIFQRTDENLTVTKVGMRYFQEWDLCVLRKILQTSQQYLEIREYVDTLAGTSNDVYMRGLAAALQDEVLTVYESDVCELEKEVLFLSENSSSLSLTNVKSRICDKWNNCFEIISVLRTGSSGHIVDVLVGLETSCVDKYSRSVLAKLKSRMISILFREIVLWATYGVGVCGRHECEIPSKIFDDHFRSDVMECGELAQILNLEKIPEKISLPGNFEQGDSDFSMTEKMRKYVCERKVDLNGEVVRYLRDSISPSLSEHLSLIRGVFLLGFGDLWEEFILTRDFSLFDLYCVSGILEISEKGIRMDPVKSIGLILRPDHLQQYTQLSEWLLSMKRCLVDLTRGNCDTPNSVQFMTNLFTFIQQDVIEEEWRKLTGIVVDSEDLRTIQRAHERFLDTIVGESMFGLGSLRKSIDEIVGGLRLVAGRRSTMHDPRETEGSFNLKVRGFISGLMDLRTRSDFRRIDRLLLRLDFNRFYRR